MIIGIAGGTCAGKTTIVRAVCERIGPDLCTVVSCDDYYRDIDASYESLATRNWDEPNALDLDRLAGDLERLRAGEAIDAPIWDMTRHRRATAFRRVEPRPTILVDGLLALAHPGVRAQLDLGVYVDAPADVRLARRLRRDALERGRSTDSILTQYMDTVRPMHDRHVATQADHADLVVDGESDADGPGARICAAIEARR